MSKILSVLERVAPHTPNGAQLDYEFGIWCPHYGIVSDEQLAAFLAQCAHESGGFYHTVENLNYSANGLARTWPSRFSHGGIGHGPLQAANYAFKPEEIANEVYANRMGNGSQETGDGFRYRGRGFLQITGKDMYVRYAQEVNDPGILLHPDRVADIPDACRSACWVFAKVKALLDLAEEGSADGFREITRRINGGYIGLAEREKSWREARDELGLA